jgi:DNA/RNA endonuclease YhcR with UshA esterase domain
MKTFFVSLLILAGSLSLKAQTKVELADVAKHTGDSVIVHGKVFGQKAVNGGKLLLVNLGGAFPDQLLTVVLGEETQKALAEPLKSELEELSVAGKVEVFKGKPQIVVKSPAQIQRLTTVRKGAD